MAEGTRIPRSQQVPLRPDAPNVSEFAEDMAELGGFSARELAVQYLDQYLSPAWDGTFTEAVRRFIPTCRDYV